MRGAAALFGAATLIAAFVLLALDPEAPWAVALLALAVGAAAAALALWWQLRAPPGRRRPIRPPLWRVVRRATETGAIAALFLWLRAVDGLSPLTATFVVASFVIAEIVASARPQSSR